MSRRRRGFTLVEIVVTIGVVAVLFASVVYGMGALTGARAKEGAAQIAGLVRSLYDTAALSGKTCRLVFDLPAERDSDGQVAYRAECAQGAVTASAKRDDELKAARDARKDDGRLKRMDDDGAPTLEQLVAREKQRVDDAAKFSAFQSDDVGEYKLPDNVRVEVWTQKQHSRVKSGPAYLYFFPQGFTERAQLYVKQGNNTWTIVVSPLTGKTTVFAEDLEVPRS